MGKADFADTLLPMLIARLEAPLSPTAEVAAQCYDAALKWADLIEEVRKSKPYDLKGAL